MNLLIVNERETFSISDREYPPSCLSSGNRSYYCV